MMTPVEIKVKSVAIVKFGPAGFETDGFRPGEYFQVTIDPAMIAGDFIRFGKHRGDEIVGWQRIGALTVVQILGEWNGDTPPDMHIGADGVTMTVVS